MLLLFPPLILHKQWHTVHIQVFLHYKELIFLFLHEVSEVGIIAIEL